MSKSYIDSAQEVRPEERLDIPKLEAFLVAQIQQFGKIIAIKQFPGGYSNLTYLISTATKDYVLRRPPKDAQIKSAHDMFREYKVLSLLKPIYKHIPMPILYCDQTELIGAPFYMMERVEGVILRNSIPKGLKLSPQNFRNLSTQSIENLIALHNLELNDSNLISLGKPEDYVARQVKGWIKRYFKAETDSINEMNFVAEWLQENQSTTSTVAFIHNDYKYDNLVLDEKTLQIKAVLDWEMATVGDPLMDLGTTLAYWVEAEDNKALRAFNLTWVEGNLSREDVSEFYANHRDINVDKLLFYYVFGCFKLGVIAQQIYARYKKGYTKDQRFAMLIYVVKACADNAKNAIKFNRIHHFKG